MGKKIILFDLDGTLTDPREGIVNCVKYTLKYYGIYEKDEEKLLMFIGPPLKDSFMKFYSFDENKALEAVSVYRKEYASAGIFQNKVYEGIEDLLKRLKAANNVLCVATSKPQTFADNILKKFGLYEYFNIIVGSNDNFGLSTKESIIIHIINKLQISSRETTIMVGDRKYDIIAAKKCGITSVGVLFGYGDYEELSNQNPDYILSSVKELDSFLTDE